MIWFIHHIRIFVVKNENHRLNYEFIVNFCGLLHFISHRVRRGRRGIVTTSYFKLRTSSFVWHHSMPGAGTRRVESPWLAKQ